MSTRFDVEPTVSTPRRAWFALAVLLLPVLLIAVDNTILAFALPSIAAGLPARRVHPVVDRRRVLAGAGRTAGAMGSLGDRIGRRRMLMIGAAASPWCRRRRRSRPAPDTSSPPAQCSASSGRC